MADWVAAVAATIAALIVCWQSWETRRSANASRDAARTANEALDLTRQLAADGVRTRLDADMPAISVHVNALRDARPIIASSMSQQREQFSPDTVFRLPRDGATYLSLLARAAVLNDSDRHAEVNVNYLPVGANEPTYRTMFMPPGAEEVIEFEICRMVTDWVNGEPGLRVGGTTYYAVFGASYINPADTSASDGWELSVVGSPLVPVPGETAAYAYSDRALVTLQVSKRREYWLSRRQQQQLQ